MPVDAVACVRRMRGGAQAHLIKASDGRCYVVKFKQNPQHRRILINEWIAGTLLTQLDIACPRVELVRLTEAFLAEHPEVEIQLGGKRHPVDAGFHFGSLVPVDPDRTAIYDYLPDALLTQTANLPDFLGVLAFDKWAHNADSRQAVFFRARIRDWITGASTNQVAFIALMMDHGYVFGGPEWRFDDSPVGGLYNRRFVYDRVRGLDDFQPWLERIREFPLTLIDSAFRQIPEWWLNGDRDSLEQLLERLYRRRQRVQALLEDARRSNLNPFPNWR